MSTHESFDEGFESVDLSEFSAAFHESPGEEEIEPVPDGKYRVSIDKAALTHAKTSGKPMLRWTLRILGPTHRGRLLWRNSVISHESIKYLKLDLLRCGLKLQDIGELPARVGELLDVKLLVTKTTRDDNERIYFSRRLTPEEIGADAGTAAGDALAPF
jgi:hypothetical protein